MCRLILSSFKSINHNTRFFFMNSQSTAPVYYGPYGVSWFFFTYILKKYYISFSFFIVPFMDFWDHNINYSDKFCMRIRHLSFVEIYFIIIRNAFKEWLYARCILFKYIFWLRKLYDMLNILNICLMSSRIISICIKKCEWMNVSVLII